MYSSNTYLHPARSLHTSTITEWITFPCLSLVQVRPVSPDFRIVVDWLKCTATHRKLLCWPVDIHFFVTSGYRSSKQLNGYTRLPIRQTRKTLMIYLLTVIGLSPGSSSTVHIYTQTIHRTTQNKQYIEQHNNFGRVRAVPRLGELYPGI